MRTDIDRGIFTIAGVLTRDECQEYISWSESLGYETAPVSLAAGQVLRPDIRNNARVMVDSPERANAMVANLSGRPANPRQLESGRSERAPQVLQVWPGAALRTAHGRMPSAKQR